MKEYTLIIIFGDRIEKYNGTSAELLAFLQRQKDALGEDELRCQYQLKLQYFSTKEEKEAFIEGLETASYDHEDMALVDDGMHDKEFFELFGVVERKFGDRKPCWAQISEITRHVTEITESSWIPFASPAPSSTEAAIKREVLSALEHLKAAETLCKCYR